MSKNVVVSHVDDVTVALTSNPPKLSITARTMVPTLGWKPELVPYYGTPPADGFWAFVFIAERPDGFAGDQRIEIMATSTIENPESLVRGVRVHASENAFISAIPGGKIFVQGRLTDEGVEAGCYGFRTDADADVLYTLVGDRVKDFQIGDRVDVSGTLPEASICMQGITIAVDSISKAAPKTN